jgi:hypothetical protein
MRNLLYLPPTDAQIYRKQSFSNSNIRGGALVHAFVVLKLQMLLFVSLALQPSAGYGHLVPRRFVITHPDAQQSVGLLWTSDQLITETST